MVAGVGYVVDSLASLLVAGHGGLVFAILVTPAVVGELGLTAWLLLKGVTTEPPPPRAVAAAPHPVR